MTAGAILIAAAWLSADLYAVNKMEPVWEQKMIVGSMLAGGLVMLLVFTVKEIVSWLN